MPISKQSNSGSSLGLICGPSCDLWASLARVRGSVSDVLGVGVLRNSASVAGIPAINWGLVSGRSNTIYPWSSWLEPFDDEPASETF
jgi:hypothetical protein